MKIILIYLLLIIILLCGCTNNVADTSNRSIDDNDTEVTVSEYVQVNEENIAENISIISSDISYEEMYLGIGSYHKDRDLTNISERDMNRLSYFNVEDIMSYTEKNNLDIYEVKKMTNRISIDGNLYLSLEGSCLSITGMETKFAYNIEGNVSDFRYYSTDDLKYLVISDYYDDTYNQYLIDVLNGTSVQIDENDESGFGHFSSDNQRWIYISTESDKRYINTYDINEGDVIDKQLFSGNGYIIQWNDEFIVTKEHGANETDEYILRVYDLLKKEFIFSVDYSYYGVLSPDNKYFAYARKAGGYWVPSDYNENYVYSSMMYEGIYIYDIVNDFEYRLPYKEVDNNILLPVNWVASLDTNSQNIEFINDYGEGTESYSVIESSVFIENEVYHEGTHLFDKDKNTAWIENQESLINNGYGDYTYTKEGSGISEWVKYNMSYSFDEMVLDRYEIINTIDILNGYCKSEELYYLNNRVRILSVEFSDGSVYEFELDDVYEKYQRLELPEPKKSDYIIFRIIDTYNGSQYNDTCISEIVIK